MSWIHRSTNANPGAGRGCCYHGGYVYYWVVYTGLMRLDCATGQVVTLSAYQPNDFAIDITTDGQILYVLIGAVRRYTMDGTYLDAFQPPLSQGYQNQLYAIVYHDGYVYGMQWSQAVWYEECRVYKFSLDGACVAQAFGPGFVVDMEVIDGMIYALLADGRMYTVNPVTLASVQILSIGGSNWTSLVLRGHTLYAATSTAIYIIDLATGTKTIDTFPADGNTLSKLGASSFDLFACCYNGIYQDSPDALIPGMIESGFTVSHEIGAVWKRTNRGWVGYDDGASRDRVRCGFTQWLPVDGQEVPPARGVSFQVNQSSTDPKLFGPAYSGYVMEGVIQSASYDGGLTRWRARPGIAPPETVQKVSVDGILSDVGDAVFASPGGTLVDIIKRNFAVWELNQDATGKAFMSMGGRGRQAYLGDSTHGAPSSVVHAPRIGQTACAGAIADWLTTYRTTPITIPGLYTANGYSVSLNPFPDGYEATFVVMGIELKKNAGQTWDMDIRLGWVKP